MHLFLSPHMDDTTLSCGGLIADLCTAGAAVQVVNIMAGYPPHPLPDSPLVRELHTRWNAGESPIDVRRDEERRANAQLGVADLHLWDVPDCVYRTTHDGVALYTRGDEDLFGAVHPDDPAVADLHGYSLPPASRVYAPLGIGGHVDHIIVHDWALKHVAHERLIFYEDYPYATDEAAGLAARSALPLDVAPSLVTVTPDAFARKCAAIACYQSQISTFWRDDDHMRGSLRDHMAAVGDGILAERYWSPLTA